MPGSEKPHGKHYHWGIQVIRPKMTRFRAGEFRGSNAGSKRKSNRRPTPQNVSCAIPEVQVLLTRPHLYSPYGQLQQLHLLGLGQDGGAVGACLIKVRLNGWPVVRDGTIHGPPVVEDKVAVHLVAVKVL